MSSAATIAIVTTGFKNIIKKKKKKEKDVSMQGKHVETLQAPLSGTLPAWRTDVANSVRAHEREKEVE